MTRILSAALVTFFVVATAVAFAVTERLKLVRTPVTGPRVTKLFSPVCECPPSEREAAIRFRLRRTDRVTLGIVDGDGEVVRTLVSSQRRRPGVVLARWDGRDDGGTVVPDGSYNPRVHLAGDRRTIVLPAPIEVDTTSPDPPTITRFRPPSRRISPNGDGRRDWLRVHYAVEERAYGVLFVEGVRTTRTRSRKLQWHVDWLARLRGRRVRPGAYTITLAAEDVAGNVSAQSRPMRVRVEAVRRGRRR